MEVVMKNEFWISLGEECDDIVWRYHPKNEHYNYHVIEFSAYEQAQQKIAELEAENKALKTKLKTAFELLMGLEFKPEGKRDE